MTPKPILLSGIQPSGPAHIGNYFGAMRQFVELQDKYQSFIMLADYHALTTVNDPAKLREYTKELAVDYLAVGLDPTRVVIFKQSDVAAHAELAWIFECLTTLPYLMRAHGFKDAEAKGKEINVGVFTYPMLMAADILLYDTDVVPVGHDQKQHLEMTRDTAAKFNRLYGETFKLPEPLILAAVETVPGLDGRKMSKSYGNTIPLFAADEEIAKLVMSIVTDSSGEVPQNVYKMHKLFRPIAELDALYAKHKGQYQALKEMLADDIKKLVAPLRERRQKLAGDTKKIEKILTDGAVIARARASAKMQEVRKMVGAV